MYINFFFFKDNVKHLKAPLISFCNLFANWFLLKYMYCVPEINYTWSCCIIHFINCWIRFVKLFRYCASVLMRDSVYSYFLIYTVDPWTIWVWTVWIHLYMDFFQYSTINVFEVHLHYNINIIYWRNNWGEWTCKKGMQFNVTSTLIFKMNDSISQSSGILFFKSVFLVVILSCISEEW